MNDMLRVSTNDKKYTIIQDCTGRSRALRHGEEWPAALLGNMTLAFAYDLENERSKHAETLLKNDALEKRIREIEANQHDPEPAAWMVKHGLGTDLQDHAHDYLDSTPLYRKSSK